MVYTKKFCTLNTALIPTPVMSPEAPQWVRQSATVRKGNESTKVEWWKFSFSHLIMQRKIYHNHTKCARNKNIKTWSSIHSKWVSIHKYTSSGSCLQGQHMKRWFLNNIHAVCSLNLNLHQKEWPIYSVIFSFNNVVKNISQSHKMRMK